MGSLNSYYCCYYNNKLLDNKSQKIIEKEPMKGGIILNIKIIFIKIINII